MEALDRSCLFGLVLTVACGPSSAVPEAGSSPTPQQDRTAPSIQSRVPAPGSSDGTATDPIDIIFSEPLDPSAPTTLEAQLEVNGTLSPASVRLAQPNRLIITQSASFPVPATVAVQLKGSVKDLAGNARVLDGQGWTFSVAGFVQVARLDYQLCGMVELRGEIWLSDCYGLRRLESDGGTTARIPAAGHVNLIPVQSPPGELFLFAETGAFGAARETQLFHLDAGARALEPVLPPLNVAADTFSWFLAANPSRPLAAFQSRPADGGLGQGVLHGWAGTGWTALTVPLEGVISRYVETDGGVYAFIETDHGIGAAQVAGDGGWAPVGERFPVDALGLDRDGALVRSAPWYTNHRLERWNGTDWVPISYGTFRHIGIAFAFDSRNVPAVVTFQQGAFGVHRLTPFGWRQIGQDVVSTADLQVNVSISFDPEDHVIVAWSDLSTHLGPTTSFVLREAP